MSSPTVFSQRQIRAQRVAELRRLLPAGSARAADRALPLGVAAIDAHLPHGGLTLGALHEIASDADVDRPAAFGFAAALLGRTAADKPVLLILSAEALPKWGRPYGHGLQRLGLDPARLIIAEADEDRQRLWAMQEALRSGAPAAVAGALDRLDLKTSQRLHHAAGEAGLPLFLLRPWRAAEASAAATRWRVRAADAVRDRFGLIEGWRWRLSLERCRNGRPGEWLVEFDHVAHRFSLAPALADPALSRRAGAPAFACAR